MVNFTSKKLSFENKLENLKEFISNYTSAIIAYSGGIDSSLIAQLANNVLGKKNTLVVIAVSPSLNNKEFKLATNLAKMNNWNYKPIYTQEFSNDNYLKNDLSRWFYCKFELYEKLERDKELYKEFIENEDKFLQDRGYDPSEVKKLFQGITEERNNILKNVLEDQDKKIP